MSELPTHLEQLPPMRVASVREFSATPECDAWNRLHAWAAPRGLLLDQEKHPIFGFNNPPPSPTRREYGYEFWIRVDPGTPGDGAVELKDFAGGLYLVTRCQLSGDPAGEVGQIWMKLWEIADSGSYRLRDTHELERPGNPLAQHAPTWLDLYLPVQPA
jgi:DNA gyrase inhibitor GyrI